MSEGRGRIEITGLREFQKAVREVDAGMPKLIRLVLNEAGGLIVTYAQNHIAVKSGRAKASIKARSTQRLAQVAIGGNRAAYTPWWDFGGEGRIKGRPAKRTFIKEGRLVYKGLRIHHEDITEVMERGLAELAQTAGLEID